MFKLFNPFEKIMNQEKEEEVGVEDLHSLYLGGNITQEELFQKLPVEKISEFVEYHNSHKEELPQDDKKIYFKINQLDNIIEKGILEKNTYKEHGQRLVERVN